MTKVNFASNSSNFESDYVFEKPKSFVSYAHESVEFRAKVMSLVEWLRPEGCTVFSDHEFTIVAPEKGWLAWMED